MILAATVGREKSCVALYEVLSGPAAGDLRLLRSATVDNGELAGLRPLLRRFAAQDLPALRAACLSVEAAAPWAPSESEVAAALGLPEAELVAPAVACAEWLPAIGPDDVVCLLPGDAAEVAELTTAEGIWVGLGSSPGLARVSPSGAAPVALDGDLPAICRELAAGDLAPLAEWLGRLAGALASGAVFVGGELARGALAPRAAELRRLLGEAPGARAPVWLVEGSPSALYGAARRAARRAGLVAGEAAGGAAG